jgi:hypothetical protein
MQRLFLTITPEEWAALVRSARQNYREPKNEARYLLQKAIASQTQENHNRAAEVVQTQRSAVVAATIN